MAARSRGAEARFRALSRAHSPRRRRRARPPATSGPSRFPPRLPGQPIFYPVLNQEYATRIARDWNTKDAASGHVGYVLRFEVDAAYASRFEPQRVGGAGIDELWVPAEELEEFNAHIVGRIECVNRFGG